MAFSPWKQTLLAAACALVAFPALAQQPTYSSSSTRDLFVGEDIDGASLAPTPSPQYGGGYGGYGGYHESHWSHLIIEAGGGFTAPLGNAKNGGFTTAINGGQRYGAITWGGNFMAGGGWQFSKNFGVMGEWRFNDNKIPGNTLSAIYNADAVDYLNNGIYSLGGNVHLNSLGVTPIFYYYNSDKHPLSGYVLGGVSWDHQSINFTAPVVEESFYGEFVESATIASYTNNAFGLNFGTGVAYKVFGPDSHAKLFAEVRYLWANTPKESASDITNPNVLHIGTEELLPVTVGIRF
jgi:hypothetical protein